MNIKNNTKEINTPFKINHNISIEFDINYADFNNKMRVLFFSNFEYNDYINSLLFTY